MEVINTSVANAQSVRAGGVVFGRGAESADAAGRAAGRGGSSSGGVDVPFTTLNVTVNSRFDEAILQIRDPQTGDVEQQIPSLEELETRQQIQRTAADERAQTDDADDSAPSQAAQRSDDSSDQSIRVQPGNSNESAQVQLNQNGDAGGSESESRNADTGIAGQAVAALQAASAGGGSGGNGAQSAQVSVLA